MTTNTYAHVSVFLNFESHLASVFMEGKLVLQKVPFPAGQAIPSYSSFRAQSRTRSAYIDNVRITTGIPAGLSRAGEIQLNDALMPLGCSFKFR
jgi:hypothetical protein